MASGALGQCGAVDFATMDMVMLRCLQAERNREARQEWYRAVFQHEGLLNHQLTDLNAKCRDLQTRACATLRVNVADVQQRGVGTLQVPQECGARSGFSSATTMPYLPSQGQMTPERMPVQAKRSPAAASPVNSVMFGPPGLEHPRRTTFNGQYRQDSCEEMPDQVGAMTRVDPVPSDVPIPLKLTIGTPPGLSLDSWNEEASTEASSNAGSTGPKAQYEDKKLGSNRPMRAIEPGATTLLVRNVPSRYTHKDLLEEWADEMSNFDMIYRPYSLAMKRNLGHAVMNFVSHEAAVNFQIRFHGKRLKDHGRTRALDIAQSEVQGYEANLLVLRRKVAAIKNESCLPVFLNNGRVLDTRQEVERVAARLR